MANQHEPMLSDAQVLAIRRRYARGEPQRQIARLFGISSKHVNWIVHGRARARAGQTDGLDGAGTLEP